MIPATVHRIWLDDPLPEPFARNGERWGELHPGWRVIDRRDRAQLPPLRNQQLFDRARELYPADWKRFEADLLRLELLWLHGGVYADTDVTPRRHLGPLLDGRQCVAGRSPQHLRGAHPITNAVMAAEPKDPWVEALIDGIPDAVDRFGHLPLARSVGPWHLTRVYEAGHWPGVTVLDHGTLYGGQWLTHAWNSGARRRGAGVR